MEMIMQKRNLLMKKEENKKWLKYFTIIINQRVTKDKDGNDIIEEITIDEYGNKTTKK